MWSCYSSSLEFPPTCCLHTLASFSVSLIQSFLASFQLWLSGFWPRGSLGIMKQTLVSAPSAKKKTPLSTLREIPLSIHSSSAPMSLSSSPGALYSRKVTLDGEEVSLQIQDTPCVALQVTRGKQRDSSHVSIPEFSCAEWIDKLFCSYWTW